MVMELLPEDIAKERGAQCLDHSPAGWYIREQDPKKWVIFLEGGGLCVEPIDCMERVSSPQGSSKHWNPKKLPEGPSTTSLSPLNPFAEFSQVYIPYCSGDTWLGDSSKGHPALLGLQMSGHLILETLVQRLLNNTRFASATDIILSGSSAGGIGTYHHTDWLADLLAARAKANGQASPRVVGFPIEGMFFPEKWPVLVPEFAVGVREPFANFMSQYLALLQNPWYPPACIEASKKEGFKRGDCFDVSRMIKYTKTPLFIGMNRFDPLLIQDVGICLTCKASDKPSGLNGRFIRFYGSIMEQTVIDINRTLPQTGWFIPSEFHHDENFYRFLDSTEKSIQGMSLRAAFEAWYYDRRPIVLLEATCQDGGPCVLPSGCHNVSGNYTDTKWGKNVSVVQTACDIEVEYGGQTLAGNVLGDSIRVATLPTSGTIQEGGDVKFADGRVWTKKDDQLESMLVV